MKIYRCDRCEGCGYITGGFRWETPWTRAVRNQAAEGTRDSILEAQACPDCGGTGALIVMDSSASELALPSSYGIPRRNGYAHHVALVRRMQGRPRAG
ncbi:MAG TPA: hypothetical protein VK939_18515 [Longimicrobiales bacterium]|nr:hypothetical protein [Longimicrobiales bacterium]